VQIFALIGSNTAAQILNFVVLTAALSVYNSGVYCNSRMLFGLAEQGDAPKALMKLTKNGVPLRALGVSALVTILCVVVNYVAPHKALELLFALVVASLMINWALISLTHLKFRKAMAAQGVVPSFKAFWSPLSNIVCLAFMVMIVSVIWMIPDVRASVYAIPVWLLIIYGFYRIRLRTGQPLATQR
jgi:L-asparagine transporter-like permease